MANGNNKVINLDRKEVEQILFLSGSNVIELGKQTKQLEKEMKETDKKLRFLL